MKALDVEKPRYFGDAKLMQTTVQPDIVGY